MKRLTWSFPILLAAVACGDNDGTAPLTTVSPAPGTYREAPAQVALYTDEAATIYYTIDGSAPSPDSETTMQASSFAIVSGISDGVTLSYYAVDADGNAEEAQSGTYTVDLSGPEPVGSLSYNVTMTDTVELSWTAPADTGLTLLGYYVAKINSSQVAQLFDHQSYAAGDTLDDGGEIVYAGTDLSFTDSSPGLGGQAYSVWAHYDNGTYSYPLTTFAPLAAQAAVYTGQMTIDATDPDNSSVTTQPSGFTVSLDRWYSNNYYFNVINDTNRILHNPVMVITAVSEGDVSSTAGTLDGDPYYRLNSSGDAMSLPAGYASSGRLYTTGMSSAAVTIDFEIRASRAFVGDTWNDGPDSEVTDILTERSLDAIPAIGMGAGGYDRFSGGEFSGDGRYMFLASATSPQMFIMDSYNWSPIAGMDYAVTKGKSAFSSIVTSSNAIYGLLMDGAHTYKWQNSSVGVPSFYLVKIDKATLGEIWRVEIPATFSDSDTVGKRIAMSADGTKIAVPLLNWRTDYDDDGTDDGSPRSEVHIVDLATRTVSQSIDLTGNVSAQEVAFSADGTMLYTGSTDDIENYDSLPSDILGIVNLSTEAVSTVDVDHRVVSITIGSDGTIYLGGRDGLYTYDAAMQTATSYLLTSEEIRELTWATFDGEARLIAVDGDDDTIHVIDVGTDSEDFAVDTDNYYLNWVTITPF